MNLINEELKNADKQLKNITKRFSLTNINPINKYKTFNSKNEDNYNYNNPKFNINVMKKELEEIKLEEKDYLSKQIKNKKIELQKKIRLIENVGTEEFTKISKNIYPYPNKNTLKKAYKILELKESNKEEETLSGQEIIKYFKKVLKHLKLDYTVTVTKMITKARVLALQKKLELKKNTFFTKGYTNRLLIHEIGTHIFRCEGGKLQDLSIFASGFSDYLESEEGLAAYNELKHGVLDTNILRNYAGRVIAINAAKKEGLRGVYEELTRFFDEKTSENIAIRVKRGIKNPQDTGGYTKDSVYFTGLFKILKNITEEKYKFLYKGKFSINNIRYLKKYDLEHNPFKPTMLIEHLNKPKNNNFLDEESVKEFI
ncbi:MAG: tyrosine/phenylalanine carboxypeptidase domain-containing protein [Candidatus Woesearchaeota archaeon]